MMEASLLAEPSLCYMCCHPRLHDVAQELVEPGVMDGTGWSDGVYTTEKSVKWGKALRAAEEKLKSPCLLVTFDGEWGHVCRPCVEKMLGMF